MIGRAGNRAALVAALAGLVSGCAHFRGAEAGATPVSIERPIVVAADTAGNETAAYAVFVNSGPATAIIEAACTCAKALELHFVDRANPDRGMVKAWPLELPAGSRTAITPPGIPHHMMLIDIGRPIAVGDRLQLRFRLQDGAWIEQSFTAVASSTEAWRAFDAAPPPS